MLQKALREDERPDGDVFKAARNARVDHKVGLVERDEQLRRHRGVDLAHAADAGDHIGADPVKRHTRHRLQRFGILLGQQALNLAGHGVNQTDFHEAVLLCVSEYPYIIDPRRGLVNSAQGRDRAVKRT